MVSWLVALATGLAFTFLQYGWRPSHRGALAAVAAALRAITVTLLVALLLDAPIGAARRVAPWVALDASASMRRGDTTSWRAALDSVRALRADTVLLFGDSARPAPASVVAGDLRSTLRSVADRAAGAGRPLVVLTDGELDDPEAVTDLPAGSRIVLLRPPPGIDVAVARLEAPRAAVAGDSVTVRATVVAGAAAVPAATLTLLHDDRVAATARLERLEPFVERQVELRLVLGGGAGPSVLRAAVAAAGDREPRNDTLAAVIDLSRAASAVFVSTSPDIDARDAVGVLRGALAIPTRGFFRVAPSVWRVEGTLAPATEQEVRAALRAAPVAILHGDTALFGPPRAAAPGPLALIVPAGETDGEWYAAGAPTSPLSAALSGIQWDSLPPIAVAAVEPQGEWRGLEVRRSREGTPRAIVAGSETPRRVVVVTGSGLSRWRFRGGVAADAFTALWGSIFDWLAAERADSRAAVPDAAAFRAGEPLRWRRGSATDTLVEVVLSRVGDTARVDTVTLRFGQGASVVESPAVSPGIHRATTRGGTSLLAVNPSSELLPREPRVQAGPLRGGVPLGIRPRLREHGWPFVLVVTLLCAEWLLRRRAGMR